MKKLKIGIFIDTFFPSIDGVIMVVDNYAKRLSKNNDVTLFAPSFNKEEIDKFPYKVVRIKSLYTFIDNYYLATPSIDKNLIKLLKKEKFDIIHIHSPFTIGKLGIMLGKKQQIPVIATMHTQFKAEFDRYTKTDKISNLLIKKIIKPYNDCYECWAVNSEVAKVYKSYGYKGIPKVVENGTDMLPVKNFEETNLIINKKYGFKETDKVFLFVGRMTKVKNIDFLIEALKILKDAKFDFKMIFAGCGEDLSYFKQRIKKYNLSDNVVFTGKITDRQLLSFIYRRATLFLFPSLMDASSLVQVEAASQKTPVLFLNRAVTAANIKDGINGYLSENNPNFYAQKIIKIMSNQKLYEKVSQNCYKMLYRNWDDLVKRANQDYIRIINEYNKKNKEQ